jgi:hypothetical protein
MNEAPMSGVKVRGAGLVLIAASGLLFKFSFLDVLRDAAAHESSVNSSLTALVFAPIALLLGLAALVLGGGANDALGGWFKGPDGQPKRARQVLAVVVLMAPGVLLYLWLQVRLSELGFK